MSSSQACAPVAARRGRLCAGLWMEYQDLLGRPVWGNVTTADERHEVLAALARQARWVTVYYGWRPNLPDEGDNHLIELALAVLDRLDAADAQP